MMKRRLLRQISTEWRSNLWLALELLIVSVVIWFLVDEAYTMMATKHEPLGFEYDHCYEVKVSYLNERARGYVRYDSTTQENVDFTRMIRLIEARPEIEAVGVGVNSIMYNGSNSGTTMKYDTLNTYSGIYIPQRWVSPDFVRVFRFRGADGETPEQLAQMLRENPNGFFGTVNMLSGSGVRDIHPYVGKTFTNNGNGPGELTLIGVLGNVRYHDYQSDEFCGSTLVPMREDNQHWANEMVVRVRDNMDRDFMESFMRDADKLSQGNYYITGVVPYSEKREAFLRTWKVSFNNSLVGVIFLAFNVFLGLLGTFWFRTQQREGEIAIRRVNGATRADVFRRTISEGLLILLAVTPLAVAADYLLAANELNGYYAGGYFVPVRFVVCAAISFGVIALMIVLGAIFPAMRAVKVNPAVALAAE